MEGGGGGASGGGGGPSGDGGARGGAGWRGGKQRTCIAATRSEVCPYSSSGAFRSTPSDASADTRSACPASTARHSASGRFASSCTDVGPERVSRRVTRDPSRLGSSLLRRTRRAAITSAASDAGRARNLNLRPVRAAPAPPPSPSSPSASAPSPPSPPPETKAAAAFESCSAAALPAPPPPAPAPPAAERLRFSCARRGPRSRHTTGLSSTTALAQRMADSIIHRVTDSEVRSQ